MCENMRNENLIRPPFQYDVTSLDKKPDNFIIIVQYNSVYIIMLLDFVAAQPRKPDCSSIHYVIQK